MLSCELCEIFKNTYFIEHIQTTISVYIFIIFYYIIKLFHYIIYILYYNILYYTILFMFQVKEEDAQPI